MDVQLIVAAEDFGTGVTWWRTDEPVAYATAVAVMERQVQAVRAGTGPEIVWLLEHPPLYTAGTSADPSELLSPHRFPVHRTGRGGRYTYHGPGQRVAYVMLDLARRGHDIRAFVRSLEQWVIDALAHLGVVGERRQDKIGIWVATASGDAKIAAIGVRVRRWVSYHGVAINVDPTLDHFAGIVPCGQHGSAVTSLRALGHDANVEAVDNALRATFSANFLPTIRCFSAR